MKKSAFQQMIDSFQPWQTTEGDIYVDCVEGDKKMTLGIRSEAFQRLLASKMLALGEKPRGEEVKGMVLALGGKAFSGPTTKSHLRVADAGNELYYDMGDDSWSSVKFAGGRWELTRETPLRFVRGQGMLPQAMPVTPRASLMEYLSRFIKADDRTLLLLEAWLVGAMNPAGPYPVLILSGEQGSAKSTTSRLLRRIVDPHAIDLREPPTDARNFVAAIKNSYVLAFDNVSRIPPWLSDSMCRIATGTGSVGGRALYTDTDEVAFVACRPILLNGIPDFVEREDLADRSLTVHLPAISPRDRKDDDTYWHEVEAAMPEMLGALFNSVALAYQNVDTYEIEEKPRMANFAQWVCAGFGEQKALDFLEVIKTDRREAHEQTLEHNVVAQAIIGLLEARERYEGTLHDLLRALLTHAPRERSFFPETSLRLSNMLKRLQPVLREAGIEIVKKGREGKTGRTMVAIDRVRHVPEYAVSVGALH